MDWNLDTYQEQLTIIVIIIRHDDFICLSTLAQDRIFNILRFAELFVISQAKVFSAFHLHERIHNTHFREKSSFCSHLILGEKLFTE